MFTEIDEREWLHNETIVKITSIVTFIQEIMRDYIQIHDNEESFEETAQIYGKFSSQIIGHLIWLAVNTHLISNFDPVWFSAEMENQNVIGCDNIANPVELIKYWFFQFSLLQYEFSLANVTRSKCIE